MIDLLPIFEKTSAYRTVAGDKASGRLSHAYLIISADKESLSGYLKILAKLILADGDARAEKLIEDGVHPDVLTFPENGETILKEDVSRIIEETFLKPIESEKKLFLLNIGDFIPPISQNKLLKTLEEPPKGVHILIGATSEYSLLNTVKSRVKKLVIPPYDGETLKEALKTYCPDAERLNEAIACGDGTVGKTLSLYGDEFLDQTVETAVDTLCNMQSSRNVLEYSVKISRLKDGIKGFLPVLELLVRDLNVWYNGGGNTVKNRKYIKRLTEARGFNAGATVSIAERITEAEKRLAANGSEQSVTEWLLFAILEEKHKWQKL